jgi:hypothetical protein
MEPLLAQSCHHARRAWHLCCRPVTDIGDTQFHKGQPVWVLGADGSQRAAEYVGEEETSSWFGGPPKVIVVYPDTQSGEAVDVERVIARED